MVDEWAGAPGPEADSPPPNIMSGWSSYRGRAMFRVLALLAAVAVTVAAFWIPRSQSGNADTIPTADRPAVEPTSTGTGGDPATPSSSSTPSVAPTASSASTPAGSPPAGATPPPGTQGPRTTGYDNTAAFTNLSNGAGVDHCEVLAGRSNLEPTKTILTAHQRTSPSNATYYFFQIDLYENGNVPATWNTRIWFGSSPNGQRYTVFLLVMDVEAVHQFWAAHQRPDGSYADGTAIPPGAVVAAQVTVAQTGNADC